MLEQKFQQTINKHKLIKKKDKLLVGVSGGPDSMALLHLLVRLQKSYKLHLVAAHFNHQLRKEANQEETFVKKTCQALGIRCITAHKNVKQFDQGDSLEQTARDLRYDFFLTCSRQTKIKTCVLAHHQDDLIETMIMRLIRGTGLRGLRGFAPKTKFQSLNVIRPLIDCQKQEIIDWLKQEKIKYCIDKTNFEEAFLRNKIRLKLMPLLAQFNPRINENLAQLAHTLSLDYDFIQQCACKAFSQIKQGETRRTLSIDIKALQKVHPALLNNILRLAIQELKGNMRRIELRHLAEIIDLIENRPVSSIVDLPQIMVKKQQTSLIFQIK